MLNPSSLKKKAVVLVDVYHNAMPIPQRRSNFPMPKKYGFHLVHVDAWIAARLYNSTQLGGLALQV